MGEPVRFLKAVLLHWGVIVTSGAFIGAISLWQSTGHFVAPWIYLSVAAVGLLIAFYRTWLVERKQVADLTSQLGSETLKLKEESERSAQLRKEIAGITERAEGQDKKELVKAVTLLRAMKSNVSYWRDIVKDKFGMAPSAVQLLPDDWPTVVYAAGKISLELRGQVDALEADLVQANALITQFLNMQINFRDRRLMPPAYSLLDRAVPCLFKVSAEFEAFEKASHSGALEPTSNPHRGAK
ncbi:MAG TPA: hypothetical protein VHX49_16880 [Candidatus Acidoferrales bacterium]|jgi:hypothetical protein|nr:hypothetical protein [Candidatus Acidoferrales bacterium]